MESIPFGDMIKLLHAGEPVKIQYCTFSETKNKGGQLITITCRKRRSNQSEPAAPSKKVNRMQPGWKDAIIRTNVELVANGLATGEFRLIYPLFITRINDKEVLIA